MVTVTEPEDGDKSVLLVVVPASAVPATDMDARPAGGVVFVLADDLADNAIPNGRTPRTVLRSANSRIHSLCRC
jgi:hypothetical protein